MADSTQMTDPRDAGDGDDGPRVRIEIEHHVASVTLSRPAANNAL